MNDSINTTNTIIYPKHNNFELTLKKRSNDEIINKLLGKNFTN